MTPFQDRLDTAMRLELAFIKTFNELCDSYKIVQYGIESTKLMDAHDFIRSCRDDTSRFVRYIPDSVLVHTKHPTVCNTTLVEFKAATTGVQKKEFMEYLSPDILPMAKARGFPFHDTVAAARTSTAALGDAEPIF